MRRMTLVHGKSKAAIFFVLTLAGCATSPALPHASYREGIVGTWATGGRRWEMTYLADGTRCVTYYVGLSTKNPKNVATYKSTWEIQGKKLIIAILKSDGSVGPETTIGYYIDFMSRDRITVHRMGFAKRLRRTATRVPSGTE